jgi:hypothetical protein
VIKSHEVCGNKLEVKKAVSKDVASAARGHRGGRGIGSGRGQAWRGHNNNWGGMCITLIYLIFIISN